jgi:hypothetical protein
MALPLLAALTMLSAPLIQESVVPAPPRGSLPRPMANTPIMQVNQNRQPVGTRNGATLTLSLDIVEAGFQAEGDHDPVGFPSPPCAGLDFRSDKSVSHRFSLRQKSKRAKPSCT